MKLMKALRPGTFTATLAALLLLGAFSARAQPQSVGFSIEDATVEAGQQVTLDVSVSDFTNVATTQFTIAWDPNLLTIQSNPGSDNPGTLEGLANGNFGLPAPGVLTFSWDDPTPDEDDGGFGTPEGETLADDTVVFSLTFDAATGTGGQSSPVEFTGSETSIEVTVYDLVNTTPQEVSFTGTDATVDVTAPQPSNAVSFIAGSGSVLAGQQITVPVTVGGFTDVTSAQFSLNWDPNVLQFSSTGGYNLPELGEGMFSTPGEDDISPGQLGFAWDDPGVSGETLPDGATIFEVTFTAVGQGGETTALAFEDTPTAMEVNVNLTPVSFDDQNGSVDISTQATLSGAVTYYDGTPIADASLALGGDATQSVTTDAGGAFSLAAPTEGAYTLSASKADGPSPDPDNGISVGDLSLIRGHILALGTLTAPYPIIAADVNGSGNVSVGDLSDARQLILGQATTLPGGLWQCAVAGQTFSDPKAPFPFATERTYGSLTSNQVDQDFHCFRKGDVNGTWQPSGGGGTNDATPPRPALAQSTTGGSQANAARAGSSSASAASSRAPHQSSAAQGRTTPQVTFRVENVSGTPGEPVTAPVTVEDFTDVTGAQFTLTWDPGVLEFTSTGDYGLPGLSAGTFGTPGALGSPGTLTFAWDDPQVAGQTLADSTTIFSITFNAVGSSSSETDISFSDAPTPRFVFVDFQEAEFISESGTTPLPVELTSFEAATDGGDVLLSWETATETGNAGFEVQQRHDGTEAWTEAGFVEGAGTTTTPQHYQRRLTGLAPGRHVFRLVQIDTDGTRTPHSDQTVEAVVSVENYQLSTVYPNPFRTEAKVRLTVAEAQEVTVEVYDVLGRRVEVLHQGALSSNTPRTLSLEGAGLASGHYFIRVTGETFTETRSVVLAK